MKQLFKTAAIVFGILSVGSISARDSKKSELNEKWLLQSVESTTISPKGVTPYIVINTNIKEIAGNDGCNSFSATISKVNFKHITVEPGAATMKYCAEQGVERDMIHLLPTVKSYKLTENVYGDDILQLIDSKGRIILTFVEADED